MTTAHRPTFVPRKGNNIFTDIPTLQFSVKDLPSNTILKLRFNEKEGKYYNEDEFLKKKKKINQKKTIKWKKKKNQKKMKTTKKNY